MIRGLKGLLALGALGGIGLLLRWVTADSIGAATTQDLTSMASLAVGSVAWVACGWLLIAVLATVLEQVPGVVGRSASIVATRITSQSSRALLRSALGVAAVTPLTIGVAHATPGDGNHQRPWTSVEPGSTIQLTGAPTDWRATEPPSTLRLTTIRPAQQSPSAHPHSAAPGEGLTGRTSVPEVPSGLSLTGDSANPTGRSATLPAVPADRGSARTSGPDQVAVPDRPTSGAATRYTDLKTGQQVQPASHVVQPGESLWSIAAAELGPAATDEAIATRWPQWYAVNRQLIGPDPDLIHPGQVLRTPAPTPVQPVPPTHQEK
ncbi:LysM domain-containing protein [Kribbella orskensis]|uniref:LysM domain-containing protein n=1 Tax=Kribbella orskensis TaxID=2512216 RepID=A0ABY2BUD0_9ACTN|nr:MULTISPECIES: LysM domain-containing protein [Kribbella]TCN44320.1 LysM domain-containing protein [Kribbella sp. VKM Ac-2500]TCO31902.1 LysM domain-containing protein [Kribbella orskensis]